MNDDLARLAAGLLLETDAEPAVRLVVLLETARRHRVGEHKKCAEAAELSIETLDEQFVFVIEHRLEASAAHVAIGRSVNGIAERHVVGGHGFRDRAGSAAHMEKTAGHLLSGADLREGPILLRIEIDLERLLVRAEIHFRVHTHSRCPSSRDKSRDPLGNLKGTNTGSLDFARDDYSRTRSALFAGIQPRRSFGNAA